MGIAARLALALVVVGLTARSALAVEPSQFKGKPMKYAGIWSRGTITMNDSGIVCETHWIFREVTEGIEYHDIKSFKTDIRLFRGSIMFSMVDGSLVALVARPSSAREMKGMLSDVILTRKPTEAAAKPTTTITIQ